MQTQLGKIPLCTQRLDQGRFLTGIRFKSRRQQLTIMQTDNRLQGNIDLHPGFADYGTIFLTVFRYRNHHITEYMCTTGQTQPFLKTAPGPKRQFPF